MSNHDSNASSSIYNPKKKLSLDDLYLAEQFLNGTEIDNPVYVHQVIKAIHSAGHINYPALWPKAQTYINSPHYHRLEKLLGDFQSKLDDN